MRLRFLSDIGSLWPAEFTYFYTKAGPTPANLCSCCAYFDSSVGAPGFCHGSCEYEPDNAGRIEIYPACFRRTPKIYLEHLVVFKNLDNI